MPNRKVTELTEIDAIADSDSFYVVDASGPLNSRARRASALAVLSYIQDNIESGSLATEQIQDVAGAMFSGNTETGVTVTYQDADGTIDVVVADTTVAGDSGSTGITPGDTLTIAGGTGISTSMSGDTLTIDASGGSTPEEIQDSAWDVLTGTQTGITVTYQDSTNDVDFVVANTTVAGDSGSTGITPGDTLTIAGGTGISTSMSGDTLTASYSGTVYTDESIQDLVGAMTTGNTETGITVAYQDADGTIDFTVSDTTVAGDSGSTGITPGDTLTFAGGTGITTSMSGDTLTASYSGTIYTDESIQDLVGAMTAGNTETGITVSYQDADGTIDYVVSNTTVAGDSGSTGITPGDTLTIAGGTSITTSMSGDTLTASVDDDFLANDGDVGTGVYDFGGATSFEIPNGATPTVDAAGEIAVDTTITDYTGLLTFHDGTEAQYAVSLPTANLSTVDGAAVLYDATNDEFTMDTLSASPGGSDTYVQYNSSGSFAGDNDFTYDGSGGAYLSSSLNIGSVSPLVLQSGAISCTSNLSITSNGGDVFISDGSVRRCNFDFANASVATRATFDFTQSANRVYTFPDATLTFVGADTTQTLTNKTIDGDDNTIQDLAVSSLADGTDGELITWDSSGAPTTVSAGTSGQVLTSNGAGAEPTFQDPVAIPDKEITYLPGSFESNNANPASLEYLNGTNVDTMVRAFDDTTQEYVEGKFVVPGNVDTSGTVTLRVYVMAATAHATNRNVEFTFEHLALNSAEDFDPASPYTSEISGDIDTGTTQDDVIEATWTETISNLSWAANDIVLFRLSRTDPSATELSGDCYLFSFTVEIPRA